MCVAGGALLRCVHIASLLCVCQCCTLAEGILGVGEQRDAG